MKKNEKVNLCALPLKRKEKVSSTSTNNNKSVEDLTTKKAKTERAIPQAPKESVEVAVKALRKHLGSHDNNRKKSQEQLHSICYARDE